MSAEAKRQVRRAVRNTVIRELRTTLMFRTTDRELIKAARSEHEKIAAQVERGRIGR